MGKFDNASTIRPNGTGAWWTDRGYILSFPFCLSFIDSTQIIYDYFYERGWCLMF